MSPYPFVIAMALMVLLAVLLVVGSRRHREALSRETGLVRMKQQQVAAMSAELNRLKKEFSRKNEIVGLLPGIAKKMTEKFPPDAYPAIAVRSVKDFFHAGKVGYFAPAEDSPDYTLVVGAGFPPDWPGHVRVHADEGILGMALQKKMVVSRTDRESSSGRRPSSRSLEDMGVSPDFVAPIFGTSGTVGALVVAGCPFPPEEERIHLSMLSDLLSMALQNAVLSDPTRDGKWVDPLTGVSNRIHFLQRFESEIRRTESYRQALALFMFDIDEFKKINDTHGHHAGDVVIRKMAEIVRKNTRGYDLVGRYGGDEFMVLITSTTEEQAAAFAENLREKVSATGIGIPGTEDPVRITISGGLAMFPAHGQSTPELFQAADAALYEAKRQGRNRILVATSVGLGGGSPRAGDTDREAPAPAERPADAGTEADEFPLGELGGDLNR
jgi:diguanylate cyclase (GGDEF)-like protein